MAVRLAQYVRMAPGKMTAEQFSKRLAKLGMTHGAFAQIVRVNRATVTKWANGTNPVPYLVQEKILSLDQKPEAVKA